ncbi:polysaccharide lyase family 7 protein [Kitasatospora sp. NPDC088783]|uniref:polysaccharide lyase family 7 protein n=1 Tax=Kitasatospora sp. NPDC088783 TaxID=3364077 RepID=UPI0037F7132F
MKRRSPLLAAATAAGVVGTLGLFGPAASAATATGPITGLGGKCVDVAAAASANGTAVQLYDCNGTAAQSWTVDTSDHTVRALGKCLDAAAAGTANGTRVQLYDCNGTAAQQWTADGGGLVNTGAGKCLDVTDRSIANGTPLQLWTCTGGTNQQWNPPTGSTPPAGGLNPAVSPGGNFDLSRWQLQEPVGSPGSPTTVSSAALQGPNGFHDAYFYTDGGDGAMTFWAPEKGVTTPNSNYARSELREMNPNGGAADWALAGSHRLAATLRVVSVTSNVCVGQIHLGSGGSSTKPLIELYYRASGDIVAGVENSPDGGQTTHTVGHVAVGTKWSYTIAVSGGNTIDLTVNGSTTHYPIPSSFNAYHQYFKAGSYNQSSSDSTTKGARVAFYALAVNHG